jgi:hypothetical protein
LEEVLPDLISKEQHAFVKGRALGDCVRISHEMVQGMDRGGRVLNIILNIDMEKAFDRLEWSFLYKVLEKMGFGRPWI